MDSLLLVKANLQAEKESMKLYDHELEGQLSTMILAGHETVRGGSS